jgi:hypothetical protein
MLTVTVGAVWSSRKDRGCAADGDHDRGDQATDLLGGDEPNAAVAAP